MEAVPKATQGVPMIDPNATTTGHPPSDQLPEHLDDLDAAQVEAQQRDVPRTGPLRFARMTGSSIAGRDAAPWVTDFLNAAYYRRAVDERERRRPAHRVLRPDDLLVPQGPAAPAARHRPARVPQARSARERFQTDALGARDADRAQLLERAPPR